MEPLGDWTDVCPWKSRLVLLMHGSNEADPVNTVGGKRDLLRSDGDHLIAVWPGQWSTTARYFGPGDAEKVLDRLG